MSAPNFGGDIPKRHRYWSTAGILFLVSELAFWVVLAQVGVDDIAEALLTIAFAFWVTALAFAPKSFLESPDFTE